MNGLTGIGLLLCLAACQWQRAEPVSDPSLRLMLMGVILSAAPGLALLQSWWLSRRDPNAPPGPVATCQTAVWIAASLATLISLRWHELVRFNWGFSDWVLVDELLILAPITVSLALVGIIRTRGSLRSGTHATCRPADWKAISLRWQIEGLTFLVPVVLAVVIYDLSQQPALASGPVWGTAVALLLTATLVVYPAAICRLWRTSPLEPGRLASLVEAMARESGVDCPIVCWPTGMRMINACVLGWIPGTRRILLTDRLLRDFSEAEITAIVRHELAHVHGHHAAWRMGISLLPLAITLTVGGWWVGDADPVGQWCRQHDCGPMIGWSAYGLAYLVYLAVALRWLAHQTEGEADRIASCRRLNSDRPGNRRWFAGPTRWQRCPDRQAEVVACLEHLKSLHRRQSGRHSWMHPSLDSRLMALQAWGQQPSEPRQSDVWNRSAGERWRCGLGWALGLILVHVGLGLV